MSSGSSQDVLSLEVHEWIDGICQQFEDQWRLGEEPVLERYLRSATGAARRELLRELLRLELTYRSERGEECPVADYYQRFPNERSLIDQTVQYLDQLGTAPCRPGTRIGPYVVQKQLGQGAFGKVFLAHDEQLQREVAIKIARTACRLGDRVWQQLLAEAQTMAALEHPQIGRIMHVGQLWGGRLYVVMEYVSGQTLDQWLAAEKPGMQLIATVFEQIAAAMHYAHRRGVVHRDLKPSNVIVDGQHQPHVLDFGLALRETAQGSCVGEVAGSPAYMAPEQVRGEADRLDGRADIWALGVMFYEALCGKQPFVGQTRQQLMDQILQRSPRPPRQMADGVPEELERICLKCLAKDVRERYATAADVARCLRGWRQRSSTRRWILLAISGLLVLVLSSAGAASWLTAAIRPQEQITGAPSALRSIQLFIWRSAGWKQLADRQTLPLRSGDQVRMRLSWDKPAYAYVLWIESDGQARPVYPWVHGQWSTLDEQPQPADSLLLPAGENELVWVMQQQRAGVETILLLLRETPLPRAVKLEQLLGDLPATPLQDPRTLLYFEQGKLVAVGPARERGPDLARRLRSKDTTVALHRRIAERLTPYFSTIHGVSFACEP